MKTDFEAIVLGLGRIGSGAAYWLARDLGSDVLGLEQFELGHDRGASHDHSRIIRLSYHTGPYVELAKRAYAAWDQLERDSGEHVILKTGGLDLAPEGASVALESYANGMTACGVPFERLDAQKIRRRYGAFAIDSKVRGLFQADGGIAKAAKATAVHQQLARAFGASLREHASVERVALNAGEVVVETGGHRYRAARLVVAAGAWTNAILEAVGLRLPLEVTKEQVVYFGSPDRAAFAPERFPVWTWLGEPSFYGFPVFGEPAVKIAQDAGGKVIDIATRTFEPDLENLARVEAFVADVLPSALGPVHYTKTCLYTLTPDRNFVADSLPGHPNVAVAVGAGHAFKFASVLGKILGELVRDRTAAGISNFAIDRPILKLAKPPRSYVI